MQTAIQAFAFDGTDVRTVTRDSETWFVASDVCAALGFTNVSDALANHTEEDERMTIAIGDGQPRKRGGAQKQALINESGMYALVFRSRKAEAVRFRKWVTSEVLPSIRKTGQFQGDWRKLRHECASTNKVMNHILQDARKAIGKDTAGHHYSNEARLINSLLSGEYRSLPRDGLTSAELELLAHLELRNAVLIGQGFSYDNRKTILKAAAMDWRMSHTPALEVVNV